MGKRAEMSKVRRQAVLQATEDLLDEEGVAALTVRRVAERAGVAQGTVFLYAATKAELVNQVYGLRIAARWHELMDALVAEPPLDRIEKFYLGCVEIFYDDLDNVRAFYNELGSRAGDRLPVVEEINGRVTETLAEAASLGTIKGDVDLEALDYSYQGIYSNVIRLADAGVEKDRAQHIISESLKQLRFGVSI